MGRWNVISVLSAIYPALPTSGERTRLDDSKRATRQLFLLPPANRSTIISTTSFSINKHTLSLGEWVCRIRLWSTGPRVFIGSISTHTLIQPISPSTWFRFSHNLIDFVLIQILCISSSNLRAAIKKKLLLFSFFVIFKWSKQWRNIFQLGLLVSIGTRLFSSFFVFRLLSSFSYFLLPISTNSFQFVISKNCPCKVAEAFLGYHAFFALVHHKYLDIDCVVWTLFAFCVFLFTVLFCW